MIQHTLPDLARQHYAELHNRAAGRRRPHRDQAARPSLRVRAGWTMVDIGLRLVAQPTVSHQPRPAGS